MVVVLGVAIEGIRGVIVGVIISVGGRDVIFFLVVFVLWKLWFLLVWEDEGVANEGCEFGA